MVIVFVIIFPVYCVHIHVRAARAIPTSDTDADADAGTDTDADAEAQRCSGHVRNAVLYDADGHADDGGASVRRWCRICVLIVFLC